MVQTDKLAFADFAFDSYSQTPSFWAYVPERCNVGLFGKVSLEDGHWTYFGAFDADEKLTHYTLGNSGDFHFFTMAGVDSDDDDDGVPDSVASLCTDGGNDPSHGSGGTTPLLPVSPRLSATPLPKGETAVLAETSKFLYSGSNPVQTGVDSDAIEPRRVSVIRGRVLDGDGSPMFGAVIIVHGHPEFGETISRADGWYDMVVNGNNDLTLEFSAPSFIPAFRTIHPIAQRYAVVDDVRLVAYDPVATVVRFGESLTSACLAVSSKVTDDSGTRAAVLMFPVGTQAFSVEGAITQRMDRLTIRVTEFTVGEGGPARMPAKLPPTSAYTYCAELSADEASHVVFDRQIFGYVENFVGIPVGYVVPSAFYDFRREVPAWVPEEDGRVIGIVGVSVDGLAEIDMDGDGVAEQLISLLSCGFSADELQLLADRYDIGTELWRVPLEHFSAVDWNYMVKVVDDDVKKPLIPADIGSEVRQSVDASTERNLTTGGSVGLSSRTFLESLPIVGTGLNLVYSSDRAVTTNSFATQFSFRLTGDTVSSSLVSVRAELEIAGRRYEQSFVPTENIVWRCPYDGLDPYGRKVSGTQPATLRIFNCYNGYYAAMSSPSDQGKVYTFGQLAGKEYLALSRQPVEFETTRDFEVVFGCRDPLFSEWTVDVHHSYDPVSGKLYLGSGETLDAHTIASMRDVSLIAGTGERGSVEESSNGMSWMSKLDTPTAVCVGPDGEIYIADSGNCCVRLVDPARRIRTFAGRPGEPGYRGDEGPAVDAQLIRPCALALDSAGNLYIADRDANVIRKVNRSGVINTVAGNGDLGADGDGGFAVSAAMGYPTAIAVTRDGTIYVAHGSCSPRVRRVAPDGRVATVLGGGDVETISGDDISGTALDLGRWEISSLAVTDDESLWISRPNYADEVLCLDKAGIVRRVFVCEPKAPINARSPRNVAQNGPRQLGALGITTENFVCAHGNDLWLHQCSTVSARGTESYLMRLIDGDEWTTVAYAGTRETGLSSLLFNSRGIPDVDDQGTVYMVSPYGHTVHSMTSSMPVYDGSSIVIPSRDGSELYVFSPTGRHLETRDAVSRNLIFRFGYSEDGSLSSIADVFGQVVTFEKSDGRVVVTAPHGQVTTIELDGSGRPVVVTNPAGERNVLEYSGEGLLTGVSNRRGYVFRQTYDEMGKTVANLDPDGGSNVFSAVTAPSDYGVGWQTSVVDGMGRTNLLSVSRRSDGLEGRTEVSPDGLCTVVSNYTDGSTLVIAPDGSTSFSKTAPDPRYGMLAPYVSRIETETESGRRLVSEIEREAFFEELSDANSATGICDYIFSNGRVWQTYRDADSTVEISPMGREKRIAFDPRGLPLVVEAPGMFAVTNEYDAEGRLVRTVQGDRETAFAYDAAGCLSSVTNALGLSVETLHDAVGRVVCTILPDGSSVSNDYDRSESPVATTLPHGETHEFGWTPVGLPSSYTAPEAADAGRRIDRVYDAAREQVALVKPDGTVVSNVYDSAGRLWGVLATRGEDEDWMSLEYDDAGRLLAVYAEGGWTGYDYDSFLLMAEGSNGFWTDYEYDADFRVTKKTYSSYWQDEYALLAEVDVAYDDDGDVVGIGDLAVDRNPGTGFVESTELGGVRDERSYNGYGENVSYSASFGGEDLYRSSVKRDLLGRVIEREERVLAGDTVTSRYNYDVRGRLVSVTTNGVVSESYAYDANGNRLGGVYDAQDRQLSVGGATYAYDLNGSMTNRNGVALTWNLFGRLMSVGDVVYGRDAQQRAIYKNRSGEPAKDWLWSGSRLIIEHDCTDEAVSVFVYAGAAAPAYMIRNETTYRIITDNQGSVRLVVDATTGAVAQRLDYDSFGRVIRDTNPGFQPFGFQGGLYDPDTGLVEFGCRWYDAETGRWISKDPILLEGGWNVYVFCDNDPVNRTDPTGLWAWVDDAVFAGGGALCGLVGKLVSDGISYACGNGWNSTVGDYVGAAVGGAAAGEVILYTGNPFLAGAAGGFVGNAVGQGIDDMTGSKDSFDFTSLALDTAVGGLTGKLSCTKAGITTGCGCPLQVSKQIRTKFQRGQIHNITWGTAEKMFTGEFYDKALLPGAFTSANVSKWNALLSATHGGSK